MKEGKYFTSNQTLYAVNVTLVGNNCLQRDHSTTHNNKGRLLRDRENLYPEPFLK